MCDKIAVPHSESVERWKADWDDLKAQSTLMETASKVEELASKHLNEPVHSCCTSRRTWRARCIRSYWSAFEKAHT